MSVLNIIIPCKTLLLEVSVLVNFVNVGVVVKSSIVSVFAASGFSVTLDPYH